MSHVLYVYGTLRRGGPTVKIPGQLFNLGWFPGLKTYGPGEVVAERIEVDDLTAIDRYEGYCEEDRDGSLYVRKPYLDGYLYEYNRDVNPVYKIESGDWLDFTQEKEGKNARHFQQTES